MPALAELVRGRAARAPFHGVALAAHDHTLGSSGGLARAFVRSGMAASDVYWLGKQYSDHDGVIAEMRADGYHFIRALRSFRYGYLPPLNDPSFVLGGGRPDEQAETVLGRIVAKTAGKTLLVIDDHGKFIELLHTRFREALPRAVGVSRTRRVSRALGGMRLEMPVVDLGTAWFKDAFESPSIGRSIGQASEAKVATLRSHDVAVGRRLVTVGAGIIGVASARYLSEHDFDVELFDIDQRARDRAAALGFAVHASPEAALPRAELLLSTTGSRPVHPRHLTLLPQGALLMNAASGQDEVSADGWQYATQRIEPVGPRFYGTFLGRRILLGDSRAPESLDTILLPGNGNELLFARDGSVINFHYGATPHDPIPPRYIQVTRGGTYLAAGQALGLLGRPGGLYPMDLKLQRKLVGLVEEDLRTTGESLMRPSF